MRDSKFDQIFNNDGSDTIAKELAGILAFSFLAALSIVVSIFLFI
ncbi:hypothetical protein [Fulvivirga aurantia]|nr:hypothetical protein [Fulvivirga aurantia]